MNSFESCNKALKGKSQPIQMVLKEIKEILDILIKNVASQKETPIEKPPAPIIIKDGAEVVSERKVNFAKKAIETIVEDITSEQ